MEVRLSPETESRLQQLAAMTGRTPAELIEDAMEGYLLALSRTRETLDRRYEDIKSGRVQAVEGEAAFAALRKRFDSTTGS
jgi:predicted transcriptional regulator